MVFEELKIGKKSVDWERSKDVFDELKHYVGRVGYREWKLLHNDAQVHKFLRECHDFMVQKIPNKAWQ